MVVYYIVNFDLYDHHSAIESLSKFLIKQAHVSILSYQGKFSIGWLLDLELELTIRVIHCISDNLEH